MNLAAAIGHARDRAMDLKRYSPYFAGTVFAGLIALNIAGFVIPEERSREELRFEPPHPPLLQRWLWGATIVDTVRSVDVFAVAETPRQGNTPFFASTPNLTARLGKRYEYIPQTSAAASDFQIENAPDGIAIDPRTGALTGTPSTTGRWDVVMSAQVDASHRAEQRFALFVDDRFLLLGADRRGRSILGRLVSAAKYTIVPGLIVVLVGVLGGAVLGAVGGFYAGIGARAVTTTTTVIQAVPGLLLIFLVAVISEFSVPWTMAAVGIVVLPETALGLLGQVQSLRERDFIEAAREIGMRDREIIWSEIVWYNGRHFLLNRATQAFVFAILVDVTLGYMRLTNPNTPRLGTMVLDGRQDLANGALLALAPLAAILMVAGMFALAEFGVSKTWERPQ